MSRDQELQVMYPLIKGFINLKIKLTNRKSCLINQTHAKKVPSQSRLSFYFRAKSDMINSHTNLIQTYLRANRIISRIFLHNLILILILLVNSSKTQRYHRIFQTLRCRDSRRRLVGGRQPEARAGYSAANEPKKRMCHATRTSHQVSCDERHGGACGD